MAIGVINPQVMQGDPFGEGLQRTANFVNALQSQLANQNQLRVQPQMLAAQLLAHQLANQKDQTLLPYVGPQAKADLAYRQAQTPYLNSQTTNQILDAQKARLLMPYIQPNAQADLESTRLKNQFVPLEEMIKAQNAMQQSSRFGGAYQMAKALQEMAPAARQTWIAQNQSDYNQMLTDLGNKTSENLVTPQSISALAPSLASALGSQGAQGQQNIINPRFSAPTSDSINQVKLANQIAANNSLVTSQTRRQLEGAIQVEDIFNSPGFQSQAQNAALYAGAMGKGKGALDALSQNNPAAYEDYIAFKNQTMPLLLNRIKTLDQMGATDKQREDLENIYNKTADSLTSNPAQFITQLNILQKTLNTIAQAVQKSATPISNVNRLSGVNPIGQQQQSNSKYSQEDLEHTAKKYGMTVDQVKQQLGVM